MKAYHVDNGIFKANQWVQECHTNGQPLTFMTCITKMGSRNGVQELTQTMLIFTNRRWPKMVMANLWPYTLCMANTVFNVTPSLQDNERQSPDQQFSFSGVVNLNPKHWKPFGCLVYALKNELQQSKIYGKWNLRSHLGIYLGQSLIHNQNVALILNILICESTIPRQI